jgi:hypothetical protein
MTVETEVAALTSAVNLLTSTVNVSKATLDASVAAAEAAYDSFDDRYLGAKVSAPSLDNDGGSLLTGALYFNSTENAMYVYTGASWVITTNYNNVTAPYTLAQTLNTNGNNVTFGDNGKATFGAGDDLQIYHDGGNSIITNSTGNLIIRDSVGGNILIQGLQNQPSVDAIANGAVNLYYSGNAKLATTATGIDVTGTVTMDGLVVSAPSGDTPASIVTTTAGSFLQFTDVNTTAGRSPLVGAITDGLAFYTSAGSYSQKMALTASGNLGIGTNSPNYSLTSYKAGANANYLQVVNGSSGPNAGNGILYGLDGAGNGVINKQGAGDLITSVANAERMRIASSGNVGIGTSSITNALGWGSVAQVQGANPALSLRNTGGTQWDISNFGGTFNIYNGSDNRLRIDSSGRVGIGTASPDTQLHVHASSGDAEHRIEAAGSGNDTILSLKNLNTGAGAEGHIRFMDGTTTAGAISYLHNAGGISDAMKFNTNAAERMRIDSSGNLLAGTTSARTGTNSLTFEPSNSFFMMRAAGTGTISQVAFVRDTAGTPAQVGDIATTGTATSYNTSSDQRLKENIADANDAGSKIDAIQVRQYDWKADGSHQDYGMIAQELLEVAPEAVSVPEDSEEMMGVDYSKLVPMLIKEIQSLRNRVAQLEA